MKRWTVGDYALLLLHPVCAFVTVYVLPCLSGLLSRSGLVGTVLSIPVMFLVMLCPLACSAGIVFVLTRRNRRLWIAVAILAGFILLCGLFIFDVLPTQSAIRIFEAITGGYNPEATGFGLWTTILYCADLLLGVPVGRWFATYQKEA